MAKPGKDGMDPQALEKAIKTEDELIPEEQLDEDLSVTGAPEKKQRPQNAPG
ncbi:MAG: hypothetical protein WA979_04010 [Pacificimonas sp.]